MNIFITGMMRSGTTLLQRALNQHPSISISYQDKTEQLIRIIKKFHDELGIEKYHVLSHYSLNNDYSFGDFLAWLQSNNVLTELEMSGSEKFIGVKEVLAEEFLPYFVCKNVKCLNIVRDPRDVIASMSFGSGFEHTGFERPVLFDLKNWRKSVLISKMLEKSDFLLTIKMEDLLAEPENVMNSIYSFLGVQNLDFHDLISRLNQSSWKGNSSFGDKTAFDASAVGNYKKVLPEFVIKYIEAICHKEMAVMGYQRPNKSFDSSVISEYADPFEIKRSEFDNKYSSLTQNVEYELQRSKLDLGSIIEQEFKGIA